MKTSALIAALALSGAASAALAADAYPSRPIRFIVPFPAGSAPDHIARTFGEHMQNTLGQSLVVDNRPGAQGIIGAVEAVKSTPDGYTLFGGSNTTIAANPFLFKKLPYDPQKDFTPVASFIHSALMLVVNPSFPAKSVREFVSQAKAKPGQLSGGYASAGMQVALAELKTLAGVNVLEVPYKGVPQTVTDILGGQIHFTFADYASGFPFTKAGKLRGLAVTSPKRSPLAPEIPAMSEELPGFDISVWNGLFVRTGTPREIVAKLNDAVQKAVTSQDVIAKLAVAGQEPMQMKPDEFRAFIAKETNKWQAQIKRAGIQPE